MNAMTDIEPAAVTEWRQSGTTGASASALVAQITTGSSNGDYPSDAGDFERCERAMDMIPGLRANLSQMVSVNAYWAALVAEWGNITVAPDRSAAIKAIIGPIEKADPSCARIGIATVRSGPITFAKRTFDGNDPEWPQKLKAALEGQFEGMAAADRKRRKAPPVKETAEDKQVSDQAYGVAADELRQFIEQFEQLEAEKKDIAERQKEVMAEAKARGYDTKVMKQIMALRRRDKDDVAEEEAILDMYKAALGMV
ncbi:DUF2312 domain-containing protein [Paracoccus marcusii]|uniref:DUF2312 domain-containing protein n=1 Tax=Paracoccus marcusii TaxID=59779 RepID=UPI0038BD207D